MNTAKTNRNITYFYNDKGQLTIVQLNLQDKVIREAYEDVLETIEDRLDTREAMARDDDDYISHEEVKSRVIALQNIK